MLNRDRLSQMKDLMAERGWDLLLLYGHTWRKDFFRSVININFSGPHAAAAIHRSGEVQAVMSDPWDAELVMDCPAAAGFGAGLEQLARRGGPVAIAGMEMMEARFVQAFSNPVSATFDVEEIRRIKLPREMERMRQAAQLADRGYEHFAGAIEPGMKEYELVAEVEAFLKANGAEDNFMLIASGGTEVTGMKPPTEREFREGDSVTTELTPQVDGYWAQICRTLVLGEPNSKQRESFAIFSEAQKAAEEFLRPGVNIADVARVQNDVFRKYGYGEYTGPKYTRVRGHGLGLHCDENPYILEDVNYTVKQGMTLIAHPNTYLPLSGYMVFGDSLVVTANGCEALNHTERKLFQK
ncbi:MAG TPA: Xaa-Pro peptidase family protein [Bryobacteraceae bacterium]|nr:Xaa-Pro peptidase family protein [Bryobacteraceae bacterium]